jgi:type I restriction enzyme S subunit
MSFPRYPKYKDSGVEWLGQVPAHWEVKRLRFAAELNPSKSEVADLDREMRVSFLPMEAIGDDGTLSLENEKTIGELETGYTYFRDGDVTVAKITPCYENGKGALMRGLANGIGFGTTELIVARPMPEHVTGPYLHYLFISPDFRAIGESHMYGAGGQKRVPDAFVRNFATAFPPVSEQTAIAEFLDRETGKIDELVAEQRRLMELLKEKRQAVISHAVTRGLNPAAPLKPSGIEWLGDVPTHWEVMTLRRCATYVQTGGTPSSEPPSADLEEGLVWFTPGDFGDALRLTASTRKISPAVVASGEAKVFPPRSVLVVSIGATLGKVGFAEEASSANQQINAVIPNERIDGYFLAYSLLVKAEVMRFLSNASTIGIMNQEKTKDIWIAVPPSTEQAGIAAFLDSELAKLDTLTAEAQRAIALLQERRTALISAAVTGQIDVRQLAEKKAA